MYVDGPACTTGTNSFLAFIIHCRQFLSLLKNVGFLKDVIL
jgi:hypothetical protein